MASEHLESLMGPLDSTSGLEIISSLYRSGFTGSLSVNTSKINDTIFLRAGNIIYATSDSPDYEILYILLDNGVISESQYKQIYELQKKEGLPAEMLLAAKKIVSVKDLLPWIENKIRRICLSTFSVTSGFYLLLFNVHPAKGSLCYTMDTPTLIMEAVHKFKKREDLRAWLGDVTAVPKVTKKFSLGSSQAFMKLSAYDGFVISRVDGYSNLRQIISMLGSQKTEPYQTLYGAILAGMLEVDQEALESMPLHFDLETEKQTSLKKMTKENMEKENFNISWDELSEDAGVTFVVGGEELTPEELFKGISDHYEDLSKGKDEKKKDQEQYFSIETLEQRYAEWLRYQAQKEKMTKMGKTITAKERVHLVQSTEEDKEKQDQKTIYTERAKPEIMKTYQRLANQNYYEMLGISIDASHEEIKQAYFEKISIYDPENFSLKALGNLVVQLNAIREKLAEAYQVLSDVQQKRQYDEKIQEQLDKARLAAQKKKEIAKRNFEDGIASYKAKDIIRAADLFRTAISLNPEESEYYYNLAASLATNQQWLREALRNIRKAIKLDPQQPKYYVAMGAISARGGMFASAVRAYRNAIKLDPQNKTLRKQFEKIVVLSSSQSLTNA